MEIKEIFINGNIYDGFSNGVYRDSLSYSIHLSVDLKEANVDYLLDKAFEEIAQKLNNRIIICMEEENAAETKRKNSRESNE